MLSCREILFCAHEHLYDLDGVRNKVADGTKPFPDNKQPLRSGISIEFRNVTFKYPSKESYAFQHVSFKIGAGQLCVIVGGNGDGKSTILKLISRIYDPIDGTILIDDQDIKTLKLADLRNAMSILFQDFTHFLVTIRRISDLATRRSQMMTRRSAKRVHRQPP